MPATPPDFDTLLEQARRLDRPARVRLLRELAASLEVATVRARGQHGTWEGEVDDEVVFGAFLRDGVWDPGLLHVLIEELFARDGGTFIDAGAHIGLVSLALARARTHVRCLAFEPAPRNFELLERNIQLLGLADRVQARRLALYSRDTELDLALADDNSGDHRVHSSSKAPADRQLVPVTARRLDTLLEPSSLTRPVVIKVDTQGAEVQVLRGASQTLAASDALIIEYWPAGLRAMGESRALLDEQLRDFAYARILHGPYAMRQPTATAEVLALVHDIYRDGTNPLHLDLLLTRDARG